MTSCALNWLQTIILTLQNCWATVAQSSWPKKIIVCNTLGELGPFFALVRGRFFSKAFWPGGSEFHGDLFLAPPVRARGPHTISEAHRLSAYPPQQPPQGARNPRKSPSGYRGPQTHRISRPRPPRKGRGGPTHRARGCCLRGPRRRRARRGPPASAWVVPSRAAG